MQRCEKTGRILPSKINVGDKYGLWEVVEYIGKNKFNSNNWKCVCECGSVGIIPGNRLITGGSKSCKSGIHMKGRGVTHGMRYTKLYRIWRNMKIRCTKPNAQNYYLYGGRGIIVCDEWMDSFESFYGDMKEGYSEGLSLERINVDDNYYKGNCRWIPMSEQAKNKRNTAYITYKGVSKRAYDWAELIGANPKTLARRVYLGYSPEECLFGRQYEQIKRFILAESLIEYVV